LTDGPRQCAERSGVLEADASTARPSAWRTLGRSSEGDGIRR